MTARQDRWVVRLTLTHHGDTHPTPAHRHGGDSAERAAWCQATIGAQGPSLISPHARREISMQTHSLADYALCIEGGNWPGVVARMLSSADKLAESRADFLIGPDNILQPARRQGATRAALQRSVQWTRATAATAFRCAGRERRLVCPCGSPGDAW